MVHGTMTRAAELLAMSQPGISATIAALEYSTGLQLFVRRGSRLYPTAEAHLLYEEASRALEAVENTMRLAGEIRAGRRGHLSIVAYPNISICFLPRLVAQFGKLRPDLQIKIITRQSQVVKELIATHTFDIAITELPTDYPTSHLDAFSYDCKCILPKGHHLADREVITPKDLDNQPFVTLFRGDPMYQEIATAFSEADARWNVVAEVEFLSTTCELVASGHAVGIIDPLISAPFTEHLILKPFLPRIKYGIAILYPLNEALSTVAADFVEMLKKVLHTS